MADAVELIEFVRPYKNNTNLYVTNISKKLDADEAQRRLTRIFSNFGLLYEVQVLDASDNVEASAVQSVQVVSTSRDGNSRGSLYAFVKFYSAKAAAMAQAQVNSKWLLEGQSLKVQFANRKKHIDIPSPLYMAKCVQLAQYYLGFNGWSTSLVKIEQHCDKITNVDGSDTPSPMFKCVVRLEIKAHSCYCNGIGYGGDTKALNKEKDPGKKLELIGIAKKVAHRHAFENSFRRIIIIAMDNGKVGVEINQMDISELDMNDLTDEVIHVNHVEVFDPSEESIQDDKVIDALDSMAHPT